MVMNGVPICMGMVLDWVLSDDAHEMISWFMIDVPLYDMTIIVA